MQTVDTDLALKVYIKARATPKVVAAFAERREFDKILIYSKQVSALHACDVENILWESDVLVPYPSSRFFYLP